MKSKSSASKSDNISAPTLRKILYISGLLLITGCTHLNPIPVVEPSDKLADGTTRTVDYTRGGMTPATTLDGAMNNLRIYRDSYFSTADVLRTTEYGHSDVSLAGGILSLLGGATKSAEVAVIGGLISAGSSIASQRYQLKLQALNYEKAGDAMGCMYRNVVSLKAYDATDTPANANIIAGYIDEVRGKLRKAQIALTPIDNDLAGLKAALKQLDKTESDVRDAKASLANTERMLQHQKLQEARFAGQKLALQGNIAAFTQGKSDSDLTRSEKAIRAQDQKTLREVEEDIAELSLQIEKSEAAKLAAQSDLEIKEIDKTLADIKTCASTF